MLYSNLSGTYDAGASDSTSTVGDTGSFNPDTLDLNSLSNSNYNESVKKHSSASGSVTIDLQTANVHRVAAVDNLSFDFTNVSQDPAGNSVVLFVVDADAAGPYTLNWPSSVAWSGGTVVGEVGQNSIVEISFFTDDGGTEWYGRKSAGGFA
jgi:hypothetical protein